MKASVLPRFLLGSRTAILEIASSRLSLLIGGLFALSAGFAREYDGEDLLREPWHALRPLGASLISGSVLFGWIYGVCAMRQRGPDREIPSPGRAYLVFMSLFWMTAPMAWLYAIPYERWMSPVDAVGVNLWTLALVAAWRVVLMARVISVLYGIGSVGAFFLVMLFADVLSFVAVQLMPAPILDIMGGLRHSERDSLVSGITFMVSVFSVLSAPVWIIGSLIAIGTIKPHWAQLPSTSEATERAGGLMKIALASLIISIPLLLWAQPEQFNRASAVRLLRAGQVSQAFTQMSTQARDEYPPHWNPPPRRGYAEREPDLALVRAAMLESWPADWVAELYLQKIQIWTRRELFPFYRIANWNEIAEQYDPWHSSLEEYRNLADSAAFLRDHDLSLTEEDRAAIDRVVETIQTRVEQVSTRGD